MTWGPSGPLHLLRAWGPRVGFSPHWVRPLRARGAQRYALSMPRFSLAEIIFLRAITPAYPANHADIIFDITDGNLRDSFDIIKRYMDGMTVGEWLERAGSPGRPGPPARHGSAEACRRPARFPSGSPGPSGPSWKPTPVSHGAKSDRGEIPGASVSPPADVVCCLAAKSCVSHLRPRGLWPTQLLWPGDSPGKNTGVGCPFLLQGIFLSQGSTPHLLQCRRIPYH